MSSFTISPLIVSLGVLLAVAIVEIVLSTKWHPRYFLVGVPIFVRRIDRSQDLETVSLDDLQKSCATVAGTPLLFRRLGPNAIAFREKAFGGTMHYAPLMRGMIRRNEGEAAVVVLGLINWTFVALVLVALIALGKNVVDIAPYLLATFGVLYLIQALRFSRIAKALRTDVRT